MQKTKFKTILSCILCFVLIAAAALTLNACGSKPGEAEATDSAQVSSTDGAAVATEAPAELITELGEGETQFDFSVVFADGQKKNYLIKTDKEKVGEALTGLGLIAGDEGPYGLYVKTVDGVTVDYDKDGKYWAFYENDTLAAAGVDMTDITEGTAYSFRVE